MCYLAELLRQIVCYSVELYHHIVCYLAQLFCQIAFPDILIHPCVMARGHHPRIVTVTIIHISRVPNPLVGPAGCRIIESILFGT